MRDNPPAPDYITVNGHWLLQSFPKALVTLVSMKRLDRPTATYVQRWN
jgi:hypothetical protein